MCQRLDSLCGKAARAFTSGLAVLRSDIRIVMRVPSEVVARFTSEAFSRKIHSYSLLLPGT